MNNHTENNCRRKNASNNTTSVNRKNITDQKNRPPGTSSFNTEFRPRYQSNSQGYRSNQNSNTNNRNNFNFNRDSNRNFETNRFSSNTFPNKGNNQGQSRYPDDNQKKNIRMMQDNEYEDTNITVQELIDSTEEEFSKNESTQDM